MPCDMFWKKLFIFSCNKYVKYIFESAITILIENSSFVVISTDYPWFWCITKVSIRSEFILERYTRVCLAFFNEISTFFKPKWQANVGLVMPLGDVYITTYRKQLLSWAFNTISSYIYAGFLQFSFIKIIFRDPEAVILH